MQDEEKASAIRRELLERLRALEGPQSNLAELAYHRAREALERALEEARTIRLQAIEDARATREREMTSLAQSLQALRQSAEAQIDTLIRSSEIEAARIRDLARTEAESIVERARSDAEQIRAESAAIRAAAEERARSVEGVEEAFNRMLAEITERLGIAEKPAEGWWKRLTASSK